MRKYYRLFVVIKYLFIFMDKYLTSQIITYMGNKRKLLSHIENVIDIIKNELNQKTLITADAFSGSGIVSRLLKKKSTKLYTNDIAGYSETLNRCFLSNLTIDKQKELEKIIKRANDFAHSDGDGGAEKWIRKHWAPSGKINKTHRAYYTEKNGLLIDKYMSFILSDKYPKEYFHFLLGQLLVKSSVHNNTNGQFSAFYKDENGIGKYGGKKEIDLNRITKDIKLEMPVLCCNDCYVDISRKDVMLWLNNIPEVDIMYLDPPYNKHPYSIYYFMLDIINDWDTSQDIPKTNRGQPKNWNKSDYNSFTRAELAFELLIKKIRSKFIVLSYNNKGIIPIDRIESILETRGKLYRYEVEHKTYNKLKGIANYKRKEINENVKEYIWMLDLR